MSIMARLLFIGFYILVLAACEVTPSEQKDDGGSANLGTVNVSITQDLDNPLFNVVNYAQSQKPHARIEKNFRFSGLNPNNYQIDQQSLTTDGCAGGGTDLSIFMISDDKIGKLEPKQTFRASVDDVIKVSINNSGACESVRYKFSVIPVGN